MKQAHVRRFHSRLRLCGLTVPTWSARREFNAKTVYGALSGRFTGTRKGRVVKRVIQAIREEVAA